MRKFGAILAAVSMVVAGAAAHAATISVGEGAFIDGPDITFETLTHNTALTNQYSGLDANFNNLWATTAYGTTFFRDAGKVSVGSFSDKGCCAVPASMNFTAAYTLVGFQILSNGNTTFTVTGFDNQVDVFDFNARPANTTGIFVGFENTSGIREIAIGPSAVNNAFLIDNIRLEANGTVPEPGTLALLGLGLAGFGFSRKKRIA